MGYNQNRLNGWMLALIALPVSAFLFVALYQTTRLLVMHTGRSLLENSFKGKAYNDVKREISALTSIPPLSAFLKETGIPVLHSSIVELEGYFPGNTLDANELLNLTTAAQSLSNHDLEGVEAAVLTLDSSATFNAILEEKGRAIEWSAFRALLSEHTEDLTMLQDTRLQKPIPPEQLMEYQKRYIDILERTLLLIRIPRGEEKPSYTFYEHGLLKGLTTINGLPDNLSLESLKTQLNILDGSANIPSDTPDPKGYFLTAVETLRSETAGFREILNTFGIILSEKGANQADITQKVQRESAILTANLEKIFDAVNSSE